MGLEWIFFVQVVLTILMLIFLRKQIVMKKQIDEIVKEVTNYLSYITEEVEVVPEVENISTKMTSSKEREEEQNRLIQAVLSEYFP